MVSLNAFREAVPEYEDYSDQSFALIGRVMAMWSDIDDRVYEVFKVVIGTREDISSTIYYRFNSFNDKLEMTKKIVELTQDDATKSYWQTIYSQLKKGTEFRNNLAHNPIVEAVSFDPVRSTLQVHIQSTTSENKVGKKKFLAGINEMTQHLETMMETHVKLRNFGVSLKLSAEFGTEVMVGKPVSGPSGNLSDTDR